jgi:predicted TIM-barrel fold metal-dependent hydrolase
MFGLLGNQEDFGMESNLISRRDALKWGTSLAMATGVGLKSLRAAEAGKLIDVHHHYFPPAWMKSFEKEIAASNGARFKSWTVQTALDEMDKTGCAMAIVTCGGPGTWNGDVQASRTASREVNEFGARMMQDHPTRFGYFASIPLPDTDGAMKEIDYAMGTLKADGILLWSNEGTRYLGDPGFEPVLQELNRRKAVVYVHPKLTSDLGDDKDPLRSVGLNWENTTRTISSMLRSGILMKIPDIKFIFSHGAGLMPAAAVRLAGKSPEKMAALKGLYMDTAQTTVNPGDWAAITAFAEPSHILFGSDYPYVVDGLSLGLSKVNLNHAQATNIARGYAEKILPRLKA